MGIFIIAAAFLTVVVPVLAPSLRHGDGRRKGRLNKWGVLFVLAAVLTLVGGLRAIQQDKMESLRATKDVQAILTKIELESMRLHPYDFQIKLMSDLRDPTDLTSRTPPTRLRAFGNLPKSYVSFDLVSVGEPQTFPPGRGGGAFRRYRYWADNVAFIDLRPYPYLDSLNGERVKLELPVKDMEFVPGNWKHSVDLYVKGRFFSGELDHDGVVELVLENL